MVTFPALEHHRPSTIVPTKLYCLVTEAGVREWRAQRGSGWDSNPRPLHHESDSLMALSTKVQQATVKWDMITGSDLQTTIARTWEKLRIQLICYLYENFRLLWHDDTQRYIQTQTETYADRQAMTLWLSPAQKASSASEVPYFLSQLRQWQPESLPP